MGTARLIIQMEESTSQDSPLITTPLLQLSPNWSDSVIISISFVDAGRQLAVLFRSVCYLSFLFSVLLIFYYSGLGCLLCHTSFYRHYPVCSHSYFMYYNISQTDLSSIFPYASLLSRSRGLLGWIPLPTSRSKHSSTEQSTPLKYPWQVCKIAEANPPSQYGDHRALSVVAGPQQTVFPDKTGQYFTDCRNNLLTSFMTDESATIGEYGTTLLGLFC